MNNEVRKIDRTLFGATVLVILIASVPVLLPECAAAAINTAYQFIT